MTNFTVTENAYKRAKELLSQDNSAIALRISVEGGGCSGFKYKYELTNTIETDDIVLEKNNIKIVIDKMSEQFIGNSQIDFVEDLGSASFEIKNPNAATKCGCGSSFSI